MTIQSIIFVLLLLTFLSEQDSRGGATSSCIANERIALLNFKKSLIDKNSRLASWNGNNCCNWECVSCNNLTGHVIRLDLRNPYHFSDTDDFLYNEWSLGGQLSPSLLGLKQLNYLDLSMNDFDGHIPKFLGFLHNLKYLNLSLTGFHGLIPYHLGNLSRLEYLDLNSGRFGNEVIIDDPYWISHLTSLKHLAIKYTNFKSFQNSIKALNMLPNIAELCISSCGIGDFPASLPYVNFTNLSYLDLSSNNIDQKNFPLWIFDIKSLTYIDLHSNSFRSIPDALENLTSLQYMDFSENDFSGALPKALKKLCNLHTLIGSYNKFFIDMHEFKDVFSGCLKDNIEHLDLRFNCLNGCLPGLFGEMHKLKTLDLSYNKLSGSLPINLRNCVCLRTLALDTNNLTGKIPTWIGEDLINLKVLTLRSNNFTGNVPSNLSKLKELRILDLAYNKLTGRMPDAIGLMCSLECLDLSRNELSGNIPSTMSNITLLSYLDLSYNNLFGKIPSGNQLQTFTSESYIGNSELCGFPLSQQCGNKTSVYVVIESDYWYVSIALGFVLGGWIFWGTLLVKKKWGDAFFEYVDYVYDATYVYTIVNINRLKRKIGNETALD